MRNKTEDVRNHLVEAIERVMAINDPEASEQDKITLEQAQVVSNLADSYANLIKAEFVGLRVMLEAGSHPSLMKYYENGPLGIEFRNGTE